MAFSIGISVTNERSLGVTLHQTGKIPVWLPNATLVGGQKMNFEAGDYSILLATQFGTAGREIVCSIKGKNNSELIELGTVPKDGVLIAWVGFRVTATGEVQ